MVTYGAAPNFSYNSGSYSAFCVAWQNVGYYSEHFDKTNSFYMLLVDQSGVGGRKQGDFDIIFRYQRVNWETGDASGGANGIGGTPAGMGWTPGLTASDANKTYFDHPQSRSVGGFLDGVLLQLAANFEAEVRLVREQKLKALFLENMDSTVLATSLPAVALDLGEEPAGPFVGARGVRFQRGADFAPRERAEHKAKRIVATLAQAFRFRPSRARAVQGQGSFARCPTRLRWCGKG